MDSASLAVTPGGGQQQAADLQALDMAAFDSLTDSIINSLQSTLDLPSYTQLMESAEALTESTSEDFGSYFVSSSADSADLRPQSEGVPALLFPEGSDTRSHAAKTQAGSTGIAPAPSELTFDECIENIALDLLDIPELTDEQKSISGSDSLFEIHSHDSSSNSAKANDLNLTSSSAVLDNEFGCKSLNSSSDQQQHVSRKRKFSGDVSTGSSSSGVYSESDLSSLSEQGESSPPPPKSRKLEASKTSTPKVVKPAESYIAIIAKAILSTSGHRMILHDIYQYTMDNYEYYNNAEMQWRNGIRHNLSINECFIKNGRANNGRGYFWSIHPACLKDFKEGDFNRRQARRRVQQNTKELQKAAAVQMAQPSSFDGCYSATQPQYQPAALYMPMSSTPVGNGAYWKQPYQAPGQDIHATAPLSYGHGHGYAMGGTTAQQLQHSQMGAYSAMTPHNTGHMASSMHDYSKPQMGSQMYTDARQNYHH